MSSSILVRRMICRLRILLISKEQLGLRNQSFSVLASVRAKSAKRQLNTHKDFLKQPFVVVCSNRGLRKSPVSLLPPNFQIVDHGTRIVVGRLVFYL